VTLEARGRFLVAYIDLLLHERVDEARAQTHDRWVINKLRALASWYTKGLDGSSRLRTAINSAESLAILIATIEDFFGLIRQSDTQADEPHLSAARDFTSVPGF
jgi:hypothetical protein